MTKRFMVACMVAGAFLGCGESTVALGGEEQDDGSFLESDLAELSSVRDGTPAACAVLRLASEASLDVLDNAAALTSTSAKAIIDARKGPDRVLGTDDDTWFKDLRALDAVKYVGPSTMRRLLAYTTSNSAYACGSVNVQVLAFNDFHGNLKPPSGSSGKITTGPVPATDFVEAGGAEYLATHLKALEATNPNTVVVAAGDVIGATPLLSALFHDEPTIESMNLMGLDVAAVGNHEFDEGAAELLRMQHGGCHPTDGCQDGTPFEGAKFRYLAANVTKTATGKTILPSYTIKRFGGAKVAFIGLTLEGTPLVTTASGVAGLEFGDEADTINELVPVLKGKGVETIVVLIHEGGATTGLYNECAGISGALFNIVSALDPEVDAVIAGHTNAAHNCNLNGRIVTSAAAFGRIVTDLDLTIDELTGEVKTMQSNNVIVTRTVAKDADQTALISRYEGLAAPFANRVVATITGDLVKAPAASGESTLGDVIADAQLEATRASGNAVAAFMNPGGIRTDLIASQISGGELVGQVTYGEAFAVQPFSNNLVTLTVTGAQLKTMLEQQWQLVGGVEKANMLQVSSGFSYAWDSTKPLGDRVDAASLTLNGAPVQATQFYRITVNSFLADGGDGFAVLKSGTDRLGGAIDVDALSTYLAARSPLAPPTLGRITRR
ncbi:MAG: bifunctional metallophosphatase/5'-nucleotidase [Myxococcaceae bacterium]|nr:bifunctional metallophosphatase/5'-nucleotidase [Myxococcaceae bacterium]